MDASIQNQGGKELADRIKSTLAEPQHRYELHDPFAETTFRFQTAEAVTAKAEELGASRFQHRDADGSVKQVDKVEGQWWVRNEPVPAQLSQQAPAREDKPLASLQETIDRDALSGIEIRSEQRAIAGQGVDAETDRRMAEADAFAFRRIQDKGWQESAAVEMASNAREYPEYKTGLDKAIPGYPGTAAQVYALDAANDEKIAAKEERKSAEFAAMRAERETEAKNWTPEEAAKQVQRDTSNYREQDDVERGFLAGDMARNAAANPHYKEALEKAAPDIAEKVVPVEKSAQELPDTEIGIPMKSMPGKVMIYNSEPGMAGAEILNEDGSRISFGGKAAIAQFAEENKLSPEDVKVLNDMDSRADVFRNPQPAGELAIDPFALEQIAASRARDNAAAREALGLNSIEPNIEKEQQRLEGAQEEARNAWLKKAQDTQAPAQPANQDAGGNRVESDEIFTASQSDIKPVVPPEIEKQYLRVGDKFYHPKNTELVAFEDKGNRLETRSNSENIAESMVRIAAARGWDEIKVSGSETFRKEVWLEAAERGMHVKGYTPSEQDKAELAKRVSETDANKIEKENKPFRAREKDAEEEKAKDSREKQMANTFANESAVDAVKKFPELAGAAAAVAAMDAKAESDGLTPAQRAVVAARVRQNVVNSIERGDIPEVKLKMEIEAKRDKNEQKEYAR